MNNSFVKIIAVIAFLVQSGSVKALDFRSRFVTALAEGNVELLQQLRAHENFQQINMVNALQQARVQLHQQQPGARIANNVLRLVISWDPEARAAMEAGLRQARAQRALAEQPRQVPPVLAREGVLRPGNQHVNGNGVRLALDDHQRANFNRILGAHNVLQGNECACLEGQPHGCGRF